MGRFERLEVNDKLKHLHELSKEYAEKVRSIMNALDDDVIMISITSFPDNRVSVSCTDEQNTIIDVSNSIAEENSLFARKYFYEESEEGENESTDNE